MTGWGNRVVATGLEVRSRGLPSVEPHPSVTTDSGIQGCVVAQFWKMYGANCGPCVFGSLH